MSVSDTNNARTARRWLRFSLRGLLIASTLMGAIVGWLVGKWKSTNDRRQAIQNIAALDGFVVSSSGHIFGSYAQNAGLHVTELDDFDIWSEVVSVHIGSFRKPAENADLACLAELPEIELLNLYGVNITNDGLVHLSYLSKLRRLSLKNTSVTPHGLSVYENLRNLELLGLWEASVTDSTLQCLDALPGLKHCKSFRLRT